MHMFTCIFLAAIFCQDSGTSKETLDAAPPGKNEESASISSASASAENSSRLEGELKLKTGDDLVLRSNLTAARTPSLLDSETARKRGIENRTSNDMKPFLLFPILPFLFPKETDGGLAGAPGNDLARPKNDFAGAGDSTKSKPFIFFDFAFNIRQIPLKNGTELLDESKTKEAKREAFDGLPFEKNPPRGRRKRNPGAARKRSAVFDDFSLFPESDADEFFPKSELFFPDFSFLPNARKKLSRRKRGMKKSAAKNDLKFFMDALDEAFASTKRELERTDPILDFLEGGERPFDEFKKTADEFRELPDESGPGRGLRRNDNRRRPPGNPQDAPVIIVDKVVKIGQFHVRDDPRDAVEPENKKKAADDAFLKLLVADDYGDRSVGKAQDKEEAESKSVPESMAGQRGKDDEKIKRMSGAGDDNATFAEVESEKTGPPGPDRGANASRRTDLFLHPRAPPPPPPSGTPAAGPEAPLFLRPKRRSEDVLESKSPPYEDFKKNITAVLTQFLALADEEKSADGPATEEREDEDFDWTEKETLESGGGSAKGSQDKKMRKVLDFEERYLDVDMEKKDRQIADLNYLFVSVTIPTVSTFTLVLLLCFFFLRIKGRFCTKIFEPRKVYVIDEESRASLPSK